MLNTTTLFGLRNSPVPYGNDYMDRDSGQHNKHSDPRMSEQTRKNKKSTDDTQNNKKYISSVIAHNNFQYKHCGIKRTFLS